MSAIVESGHTPHIFILMAILDDLSLSRAGARACNVVNWPFHSMLAMMTVAAEHEAPIGKIDTIDTWRRRGRMSVPTAEGGIIDIWIVALYECSAVNGLPLDLLIEAKKTRADPVKRFGVVFSDVEPEWTRYPVPVLWLREGEPDAGRWR